MNMPTRLLAPIGALLAACCHGTPAAPPPLAGAALGGPFALTDQRGRGVTDRDYAWRFRVVYFGYTYCPDVCPTTLGVLMAGYHQFAQAHPDDARRLVPIFISVDPARDTPPVMARYAAAFGPELVGLTGDAGAIARTAKEYGVFYRAQPATKRDAGYLVDHASQVILFGKKGEPIALVPTDGGASAVAATFAEWVR